MEEKSLAVKVNVETQDLQSGPCKVNEEVSHEDFASLSFWVRLSEFR